MSDRISFEFTAEIEDVHLPRFCLRALLGNAAASATRE
jgi:hypothetical protein